MHQDIAAMAINRLEMHSGQDSAFVGYGSEQGSEQGSEM